MSGKIGIAVGVIVAIVALVVCLVPLKKVAYTVTIDYQDTETYYEDEPYQVPETYLAAEEIDYGANLQTYYKGDTLWFHFTVRNNYDIPMTCFAIVEFECFEGGTYGFRDWLTDIKPGKTEGMAGPVCNVKPGNFYPSYTVFPVYREVEQQRTVTKYRQVEKQRTVTKQHPETRYEKVTLLDYLLHY